MELVGSTQPVTVMGRSLLDRRSSKRFAFIDQGGFQGWIRDSFLLTAGPSGILGLYDMKNDPREALNLMNRKPEVTASMKEDLFSFIQTVKGLVRDNRLAPR